MPASRQAALFRAKGVPVDNIAPQDAVAMQRRKLALISQQDAEFAATSPTSPPRPSSSSTIPSVPAMARHWTQQLTQNPSSPEQRVRHMFIRAFSREPNDAETKRWHSALQSFGGDTPAAWESLAHAFFNAKAFIYYR
ncbi:MAG: hypothetical protein K1X78_05580 [Verrucomicrobiaceae bacterium]|nr:hypothetical protein [Verrucomicrobiaceae bacterium]